LKLIWHSNAPFCGTGYGTQTALVTPRLTDRYELTISAFYGVEGNIIPWSGIPCLPGIANTHGNETIDEHVRTVFGEPRNGLIVTLMDVWVLDPAIWSQFNVLSWAPVDHQPLPDAILGYFERSGAIPLAMSRFGEREMARAGLEPLYCPHAVDTEVYRPVADAREATKMPEDDFIVGMVAANKGNPSRKCFQESFEAFKIFHDRYPDTKLYLHTEITGRFQGVPLLRLANAVGIPSDALIVSDQYRATHFPFSDEVMAQVYSSLDVLLSPSAGEGFGVPVLQAQACGVPVIVSDFSAQPELCASGWLVEGTRAYTPLNAWQFRPSVPDIVDALRQAYALRGSDEAGAKAVELAADYDIDKVIDEHMLPALEQATDRFAEREPVAL